MRSLQLRVELHTAACPRFVSFVEAGITGGPELLASAEEYLKPLQQADIDTLIWAAPTIHCSPV